jgi:ligand-binding SRPBCC domain-containing protein
MRYRHTFLVRAPLEQVAEFHRRAESLALITPPPLRIEFNRTPEILSEGDEIDFTIWIGPQPVQWRARIEESGPAGFLDRQLRGPFRSWVHQHRFVSRGKSATLVVDEVNAHLGQGGAGDLLATSMWLTLPLTFSYRAWKTKRLLETPRR